ncbi:MAG: hypothetical protein K2X76_13625 [Sphingomonas sp.]|nr:hypothetical protein [Sphingomonas sp.]
MRGVSPEGFPDWEVAEIEKFRVTHPALYEWRKSAHLIPELMDRPIGRAIPLASPAKAGAQRQSLNQPGDTLDKNHPRDWAPAFAGEGETTR